MRHPHVQRLRRLVRQRSERVTARAFVLEGPKVVAEALDAGVGLEAVFAEPGADPQLLQRAAHAGATVHELERSVLAKIGDTVTPQPVLAVAPMVDVPLGTAKGGDFFVVCVEVQDPGNAGTVLRTAEAAGASAVVFCDGSVDVFNPKTVRASAGSLFHVAVVNGGPVDDVLATLDAWGVRRLATVARDGAPYDEIDLTVPVAVLVGNEARGLPAGVVANGGVTIPMVGRSESLNVGMATAVLCFEVSRQRRRAAAR